MDVLFIIILIFEYYQKKIIFFSKIYLLVKMNFFTTNLGK